jgi:hypothetical protein
MSDLTPDGEKPLPVDMLSPFARAQGKLCETSGVAQYPVVWAQILRVGQDDNP